MNFDFLKELHGFESVYENCCNAEKLAMTMPLQSEITSGISAELLAKYIYMIAHKQKMEGLSFADILFDSTFQSFINNRDVMDAFHHIRKNRNKAAHGATQGCTENAVAMLHDLHYIAGETARKLGLIKDFPAFEDNIESYPDAVFVDEEDINKIAMEMFLEYVKEFREQQEQKQFVEMKDYDNFRYTLEGNVEMHEYLCFEYKPKYRELVEYIQSYLTLLSRLSVERSPDKAEDELATPVTLDAKLIIGEITYTSSDIEMFLKAISEELPKADGFVIDCNCNGVLREFFNDEPDENGKGRINMIRKDAVWKGSGLLDQLEQFKRRENFVYKLFMFYPDSGVFNYVKILDGKDIDVLASCTEDIIDKTFSHNWWSENLNLWADFDISKYPDKLEQLQNIVRCSIPESQVGYCESIWEDEDEDVCEPTRFCCGIQWDCKSLREVQTFLDKLNAVLLSIKDEIIDAGGDGTWEVREDFAVATWDWTDEGFKIKGIQY